MIPNQKLIDALRSAANRIELAPQEYNWSSPMQCNCGILAQELLDMNQTELCLALEEYNSYLPSSWSSFARNQQTRSCSVTRLPVNKVFQSLIANGIEVKDFEKIEYLKGSKVKSENRADPGLMFFANSDDVVANFRHWADKLELKLLRKASTTLSTKVKVPQTVKVSL